MGIVLKDLEMKALFFVGSVAPPFALALVKNSGLPRLSGLGLTLVLFHATLNTSKKCYLKEIEAGITCSAKPD